MRLSCTSGRQNENNPKQKVQRVKKGSEEIGAQVHINAESLSWGSYKLTQDSKSVTTQLPLHTHECHAYTVPVGRACLLHNASRLVCAQPTTTSRGSKEAELRRLLFVLQSNEKTYRGSTVIQTHRMHQVTNLDSLLFQRRG